VARTEEWARGEIDAALEDIDLLPASPERELLESVASEVVGRDA
jgi:geranylgeranyl pyrophosphate synthase